jgi:hypothetical protein
MDEAIHDGDQYNFSSDATNTISPAMPPIQFLSAMV